MAKNIKKKDKKKTRINRNISIDKDYYNTPIIIKDEIDPKKKNFIIKIFNSKYISLGFLVFAALLIGFLMFYFINYDSFNEPVEVNEKYVDKNYLFLGDSLTYRYDLDYYFPEYKYRMVNSGINSNKTSDILDDMYNRVYKYNPSDVFILIGTNDISKKYKLQKIYDNYVSIINQIQKNRPLATIRVISLYPVNYDIRERDRKIDKNSSIIKLNESLKIYCTNNNLEYINIFPKLVDEKGYLNSNYTKDGLHINEYGYEIVTKELKKYMEE